MLLRLRKRALFALLVFVALLASGPAHAIAHSDCHFGGESADCCLLAKTLSLGALSAAPVAFDAPNYTIVHYVEQPVLFADKLPRLHAARAPPATA